jgi:hypothetical protein
MRGVAFHKVNAPRERNDAFCEITSFNTNLWIINKLPERECGNSLISVDVLYKTEKSWLNI